MFGRVSSEGYPGEKKENEINFSIMYKLTNVQVKNKILEKLYGRASRN